jgi:hypothetical protein
MNTIIDWFTHPFKNWSENIINKSTKIHYPKNDEEVKQIILHAKKNNKVVSVVGSRHSMSPTVISSDETDVVLVSLENYHLYSGDININHLEKLVTVNAGFTLGKLYDELNKHHYFLETQTASSAFTVGGICNTPVHGARLGAGLMCDSVMAISLFDENGDVIYTNESSILNGFDFSLYRFNARVFGIVRTVAFKVHAISNLYSQSVMANNVFAYKDRYYLDKNIFDPLLNSAIEKCLNSNGYPEYLQCFLDIHNNNLLCAYWKTDERHVPHQHPEKNNIQVYKLKTIDSVNKFVRNIRSKEYIMQALGKITRYSILFDIERNMEENKDMFWLKIGTRCFFMSYFIPIFNIAEGYSINNFYDVVNGIINLVMNNKEKGKIFNLDLPIEFRFVTSSNKSLLSPLYHVDNTIIYASIEVIVTAGGLELDNNKICDVELNTLFREMFYQIEELFKKVGGVPHWGKMFGFTNNTSIQSPFNHDAFNSIIQDNNVKQQIKNIAPKIFMNKFVKAILN